MHHSQFWNILSFIIQNANIANILYNFITCLHYSVPLQFHIARMSSKPFIQKHLLLAYYSCLNKSWGRLKLCLSISIISFVDNVFLSIQYLPLHARQLLYIQYNEAKIYGVIEQALQSSNLDNYELVLGKQSQCNHLLMIANDKLAKVGISNSLNINIIVFNL